MPSRISLRACATSAGRFSVRDSFDFGVIPAQLVAWLACKRLPARLAYACPMPFNDGVGRYQLHLLDASLDQIAIQAKRRA